MRFPFDGEDDDATSVATTLDTGGIITPTHTEFSLLGATVDTLSPPPLRSRFETAPWPGSTYVIREQATGRAITVVNRAGELRLMDWESGHDKRSHWSCEERGGWLGFRNPEYKTYMGQDLRGRLWASVTWHRNWEYINARRHPEGGYHLMVKHWNEMVNIEAVDGGRRLVRSNEATVWEFVKVY